MARPLRPTPPWALALALLVAWLPLAAGAAPLDARVQRFLARYARAWASLNPFELTRLTLPGQRVFDDLVRSDELDRLRARSVRLEDLALTGAREVRFVEVHESLTRGGTQTTVRVAVELVLEEREGRLLIRSRLAQPLDPDPVARGLALAGEALDAGDPRQATTRLEALLPEVQATGPKAVEAEVRYLLGVARRALGQADEARAAWSEALTLHPDFPWALNAQAEQDLLAGRGRDAAKGLARSLAVEPAQPEIRSLSLLLGLALEVGSESEACRVLVPWLLGEEPNPDTLPLDGLTKAPGDPRAAALKGLLHLLSQQPERARDVLVAAEARQKGDPLLRALLGEAWLALGRHDRAVTALEGLDETRPGLTDVRLLRALALEGSADPGRALAVYEALRAGGAHEGTVLLRLGALQIRLGRQAEGLATLAAARRVRLTRAERLLLLDLLKRQGVE